MIVVRYVIPGALILLGLLALPFNPEGLGIELAAMLVGAGLAVFLFNWFYRLGAAGDRDRDAEARAREFRARHGHWPDERP